MAAMLLIADRARRARRPGRRAFTLIELLIVILVAAIAAAVVIPLATDTETTRLRQASRMLVADLEYAQMQSMAHGTDGRLVVFTSSGYSLATVSSPTTPLTSPVDGGAYAIEFGTGWASELHGITIDGYALDGDDRLGFGIYGELDQTTAATITLGSDLRTLTITLNPDTGEATIGEVVER